MSSRHRRYGPASVLAAVLVVAGAVVWSVVFVDATAGSVVSCNPPTDAGIPTRLPAAALDHQPAAAPRDVRVTVLNGAGQRGQARLVAAELAELGMSEAFPPDTDPRYAAHDLACVAQIRFGPRGASAARALSLVVPCAELVRDDRPDPTVDLALGSEFRGITTDGRPRDAVDCGA